MKGLSGLLALSAVMVISMPVLATEIHVMSGGAPKKSSRCLRQGSNNRPAIK